MFWCHSKLCSWHKQLELVDVILEHSRMLPDCCLPVRDLRLHNVWKAARQDAEIMALADHPDFRHLDTLFSSTVLGAGQRTYASHRYHSEACFVRNGLESSAPQAREEDILSTDFCCYAHIVSGKSNYFGWQDNQL